MNTDAIQTDSDFQLTGSGDFRNFSWSAIFDSFSRAIARPSERLIPRFGDREIIRTRFTFRNKNNVCVQYVELLYWLN